MARFFDEVQAFLYGDDAVGALKAEFDLDTNLTTRTALALTAPTMLATFSNWLTDPISESWFLNTVTTARPNSLATFATLQRNADFRDLGEANLELLLGQRRNEVIRLVSDRAEVDERAANGLLAATTWVVTVAVARYYRGGTREDAARALAIEHTELLESGWEQWLDATAPYRAAIPAEAPLAADLRLAPHGPGPLPAGSGPTIDRNRAAPGLRPRPSDYRDGQTVPGGHDRRFGQPSEPGDRSSRSTDRIWVYVAAVLGALLLVALLGLGFLLGRLNPETETASTGETAPTDTDADPDGQPDPDEETATTATTDGTETADEVETTIAGQPIASTPSTEDVDDWPGGRGPIPETGPERRTLAIDPDGDLVLSGSAPSWELAMQVVQIAERNYPIDGVSIRNELTWHPDAAASVRSGDVVLAQAALFESGSSEIGSASFPSLDLAAAILASSPSVYVVVTGHADGSGDEALNVSVSSSRVDATVAYLIDQGVIPGQIVTAAAGEDDPTASNDTDDGRRSNRRVDLLFKNYLSPPIGDGV